MGAHGTNKQQTMCSTHRDIWWPAWAHQQDRAKKSGATVNYNNSLVMIIGLPTATDDNNNNNNVGLKIIAYRAIYLSMQGGVGGVCVWGGGHWDPNCNEPALGGPSLQKVENP